MTYGLPVVASVLNGGLREIISDDRFGTLFDTHDVAGMAQAVLRLLPPYGSAIGANGRARAIAMSDPQRIVDEVEALLMQPA
jgi:glycosyltransferase involved in cell wall biosynthesis